MRYRVILPVLFLLMSSLVEPLRAEAAADPGDLFVSAYMSVQQGEKAEQGGDFRGALNKFRYAAEVLEMIGKRFPAWQPPIVNYRKQRTAEAVVRMEERVGKVGPGKGGVAEVPKGGGLIPDEEIFAPSGEVVPEVPVKRPPVKRAEPGDSTADLEGAIARMKKLQVDVREANAATERAEKEKEELARKFAEAGKAREVAERQQKVLQARADGAEASLLKAQTEHQEDVEKLKQMQVEVVEAKAVVKKAKIEEEADREVRGQLEDRMKVAQLKIVTLTEQRNVLEKAGKEVPMKLKALEEQLEKVTGENQKLAMKLEEAKTELVAVKGERDEAVKQVGVLREAAKGTAKLVEDNVLMMAKLEEAQKAVGNFKAEGEEKERQIGILRKEVISVKEQLNLARVESADYQKQMGVMGARLEAQGKQLAEIKAETVVSATEKKKMVVENEILRGIVLRQQKQEAQRAATKKLVLGEMSKLEIHSKTLLKEIDFLSQPVVKLTAKEMELFKRPSLQVSNDEISLNLPNGVEAEEVVEVPSKDAAKDPVKDVVKDPVKDPVKDVAKDVVKDAAKDVAKDVAKDAAKDVAKDPVKDPAKDLAKAGPMVPPLPVKAQIEEVSAAVSAAAGGVVGKGTRAGQPNIPGEFLVMAQDGRDLFERGDYRGAEKMYEKILAKVPNNLYVLSNLGVVRFRANKLKAAEEVLLKATRLAPEDGFSQCTLGIVYYTEQKLDAAMDALTKAVAINPKDATAHNYLGITSAGKGWTGSAQKELETAVAINPDYADAHFNLAVIFATQTPVDKEAGRKYYKRSIELGAEPDHSLEAILK